LRLRVVGNTITGMYIIGVIWQGLILLRTVKAIEWALGLMGLGGLTTWGLSAWEWLWLQETAVIISILILGSVFLAVLLISVIGFMLKSRGNPAVPMPEVTDHIACNSFKGLWRLRKVRVESARRMKEWDFTWQEMVWHGKRGLLHTKGYRPGVSTPQLISEDDWCAQYLGYDPTAHSGLWKIEALGFGMRWNKPTIPEWELYKLWPPVPFLKTYRRIKAWLAGNT